LHDEKVKGSILTRAIFDTENDQRPLKEWWFDPWQDDFKYFIISLYKWHFDKRNIEVWKTHLSANSRICKLHIQISNVHMCVVPGPTLQDAVIKCVYASPGLQ
jgi:hypothetical protein